jgi:hypothetical protein
VTVATGAENRKQWSRLLQRGASLPEFVGQAFGLGGDGTEPSPAHCLLDSGQRLGHGNPV